MNIVTEKKKFKNLLVFFSALISVLDFQSKTIQFNTFRHRHLRKKLNICYIERLTYSDVFVHLSEVNK